MRQLITGPLALALAVTAPYPTPLPAQVAQPLPAPLPERRPPIARPLPAPVPPATTRPVRPRPLPQPTYPGPDYGYGGNRYRDYAGVISCSGRGNRWRECRVRTENRVALVSGNSACRRGNWDYGPRRIRARNNCQGRFAYGYRYGGRRDDGPDAGAIIAGVAVAGGLIALLASQGKSKPAQGSTQPAPYHPPLGPAAISANLSDVRPDARPTMQVCLNEAARQLGATGATRMRYDRLTSIEPGNGGWRFNAALTASYPDGDAATPIFCRATPTRVVELDFRS